MRIWVLICVVFFIGFSGVALAVESSSLTVAPDGSVGVGLEQPQHMLDVEGNVAANKVILKASNQSAGDTAENGALAFDSNESLMIEKQGVWVKVGPPIGSIITWPVSQLPDGYLECDGAWLSQSAYPELFSVLGETYGKNSTQFKLPNYQGEFLRGWDSSRTIGDTQEDEIKNHKHIEAHAGKNTAVTPGYGYSNVNNSNYRLDYNGNNSVYRNPYTSSVGGSETRPRNISVKYCIRAK